MSDSFADIATPALLLDLDALRDNIERMASFFRDRPCGLRPHFKSHKCATIAKMQIAAGARGITCATLSQAEALADAGIESILIANQVVGAAKMPPLVALAKRCDLMVAVDSPQNVRELSAAASAAGATLGILVEVDIGMGRCGVTPGPPAAELAQSVAALPGLRFRGLQGYEGHTVLARDPEERRVNTLVAIDAVVRTRRLVEESGLNVDIVSSGGTGTYEITGRHPGIGEVQAGSYACMDWYYGETRPEFAQALSVLTTVISRPRASTAIVDVGVKGIGAEFGPPRVKERRDVRVARFGSEEHTILSIDEGAVEIGDRIELIPSHGCTTCNLYRQFVVHQCGRVVAVWPIASGCIASTEDRERA